MPLNEKLVKLGVDDSEYANACPTIGTLILARFSTPLQHNPVVYGADGLFFATHPSRRIYLRPAFRGEFDVFTSEADYQQRPMLWVLVSLNAAGHHMILPIYRGRSFWDMEDSDSDEAVSEIVLQTCLKGGLNLSEWQGFILDQRTRRNDLSSKRTNGTVN